MRNTRSKNRIILRTRTIGKKITIQNDHCVTGNKIKDQPVQNKYEIKNKLITFNGSIKPSINAILGTN